MRPLRSRRSPAISSASPTPPCRRRGCSTTSVAGRKRCRGSIAALRSLPTWAPGGSWPTPGRRVGSQSASWGGSTRRRRTFGTPSGSPRSLAIASYRAGRGAHSPGWPSCAATRPRPMSAGAALEKRSPAARVSSGLPTMWGGGRRPEGAGRRGESSVYGDRPERHEAQPLVNLGRLLARSIEEYEVATAVEMPPDQLRRDSRGDSPAPERLLGHDSDQLGRALPRVRDSSAGRNPVDPGQQEHAARSLEVDTQHADRLCPFVDVSSFSPACLLRRLSGAGCWPLA